MPLVFVGLVLYVLWRWFEDKQQPAGGASPGDGGLPASNPQTPGSSPTSSRWEQLGPTDEITPGTYRASAPPQGALTMMALPNALAGYGFIDVHIYAPGSAFPDDWPDAGADKLRIEATLPEGAKSQSLSNLPSGTTVWRLTPLQGAGAVVEKAVHAVRTAVGAVGGHPYPSSTGVYAGLVRRK